MPLLRVTSTEIAEQDKATMLDFMLMRYLAYVNESPDLFTDSDWDVIFDVSNPFPALKTVADRIWARYGIAWKKGDFRRVRSARYLCDVASANPSHWHRDQFQTSAVQIGLWPHSSQHTAPVFTDIVSVTIRSWLPLQNNIPDPNWFAHLSAPWLAAMRRRADAMWFPDVPGVYPSDIANAYCEYLALRKVESWAARQRLAG